MRWASLFLMAATAAVAAASTYPADAASTVTIPHAARPPRIDGTLVDPAWKTAAKVSLNYNLRTHQIAEEPATAYVMADDAFVYVGFDVKQAEAVRASQLTNNIGCCVDDSVQIDLWPNGASGFRYLFIATPIGTRYQYSSENNVYEPTWWAAAKTKAGGFTVTMKVPLAAMHGTGSGTWRVQFARVVQATGDDIVWNYGSAQQNHNDVTYSVPAQGLPPPASHRASARAGLYATAVAASQGAGGSSSHGGADLSIPIMPGTSLVATIHPDFSDVEADQQTISPTPYARQINEVRPFFTQGASFYNAMPYCVLCPASQLSTPNIPTPREGFAIEGLHGRFSYAAFDAAGAARSDAAQVLNYASPDQHVLFTVQRVSVNMPRIKDDSLQAGFTHDDLRHLAEWVRYGTDSGTNVADGAQAQRYEAGALLYTTRSQVWFTLRKIGRYFNPADGYVNNPDIAGYAIAGSKAFRFASGSSLKEIDLSGYFDRYQGRRGGESQSDQSFGAQVTTRSLWSFAANTGSSYLRLSNGVLSPVTGNQSLAVYHGYGTSTQSLLEFQTGRFGPGRLNAWTRLGTLRLARRTTVTLELDDTQQYLTGATNTQWLERAALNLQSGPDETFGIGVRRVIGTPPMLATPASAQSGSNISITYHRTGPAGEFYAAYGDAAAFSTVPQVIVKFIRYVGGQKGT